MNGSAQRVPIDSRDLSGDDSHLLDEVKNTIRLMGVYAPGLDVEGRPHRDVVFDGAADIIRRKVAAGLMPGVSLDDLCGVLHDRDLEIWQLPHTTRRLVARQVRHKQARAHRRLQLVEAWMCIGPCRHTEPSG